MKKFKETILPWIIIGALTVILIIVVGRKYDCSRCVTDVDTVKIEIPVDKIVEIEVPVEVPIYHERTKYDTAWRDREIDTAEILRRYFEECIAVWFYTDTIQDSTMYAIINDSIQGSDITYRQFLYGIKQYEQITKTVTIQDNGFYLGGTAGRSKNEFGFGASILYKQKANVFGLNYDFINKDIYISYHRKLDFRRH